MKSPDLKRAEVFRRPWSIVHRWRTRDGLYAVEQSSILYGRDTSEAYADVCRVLARDQHGWLIVSRHRKKTAAIRALEKLLKRGL